MQRRLADAVKPSQNTAKGEYSPHMQSRTSDRYLLLIAIFKLIKGTLLLCVAVSFLGLLHKDVQDVATKWIERLHFDPDNRHIGGLLEKLGLITEKQLKLASGVGACYAALFLTEGTGLLFKKRWAKYFTIIVTASLIPLEIYEVIRHFQVLRTTVLLINIGIVCFLILMVRREDDP